MDRKKSTRFLTANESHHTNYLTPPHCRPIPSDLSAGLLPMMDGQGVGVRAGRRAEAGAVYANSVVNKVGVGGGGRELARSLALASRSSLDNGFVVMATKGSFVRGRGQARLLSNKWWLANCKTCWSERFL